MIYTKETPLQAKLLAPIVFFTTCQPGGHLNQTSHVHVHAADLLTQAVDLAVEVTELSVDLAVELTELSAETV